MNREERHAESRGKERRDGGGQLRGATADDRIFLYPFRIGKLIRETPPAVHYILKVVSQSMHLQENAEQEKYGTCEDARQRFGFPSSWGAHRRRDHSTGQNTVDERSISCSRGSSVSRNALPTRQLEVEAGGGTGGAGRVSESENSQRKRINPRMIAMIKKRDGPSAVCWPVRFLALRLMCAVDRSTQESPTLANESPNPRRS